MNQQNSIASGWEAESSGWVEILIEAGPTKQELLIPALEELGCYAFVQELLTLKGYHVLENFSEEALNEALIAHAAQVKQINTINPQNWNRYWEENCPRVAIDQFCQLVPSHDEAKPGFTHTVWYAPKMAFGTGHHASTRAMIRLMQTQSYANQSVLDLGCGTGVLGILAYKLGALSVTFMDNSIYAVANTQENLTLNNLQDNDVLQRDLESWQPQPFDIVLANINRNILVNYAEKITQMVNPDGELLLSGFYQADQDEILQTYQTLGYKLVEKAPEEEWQSLKLIKTAE